MNTLPKYSAVPGSASLKAAQHAGYSEQFAVVASVPQVQPQVLLRPVTLWMTGLSGSGKSTLARALKKQLATTASVPFILDGDVIRSGLCRDLGFSKEDRVENIRRIAEVARLFNQAGVMVIAALISPYEEQRDLARNIIGADQFVEAYISTPLAECERRDPKGLYAKARAGEIAYFTGVTDPYEVPTSPCLSLDTSCQSIESCLPQLLATLTQRNSAPG